MLILVRAMAIIMRPLLPWASASWTFERVGSWWDMLTSRGWWHHGWPRWPQWPCSPHRHPHIHHRPPLLHHLRRPPPLLPPQVCKGGHICHFLHFLRLFRVYDRCRGIEYVTESQLEGGHHHGHHGDHHNHHHPHSRQHHYNMSPVDVTWTKWNGNWKKNIFYFYTNILRRQYNFNSRINERCIVIKISVMHVYGLVYFCPNARLYKLLST